MYMLLSFLIIFLNTCICRDFYVGMFKQNDLLVAQDVLYKERVHYKKVMAKYGRIFKCPITYFRVNDRLGVGGGPKVEVLRGGLRSKYLVLRLTSPYNYPISVNIYVGCENKIPARTVLNTKPSSKPPPSTSSNMSTIAQSTESTSAMTTDNAIDDSTISYSTTFNEVE